MATFDFTFTRRVVIYDEVTRQIEASTEALRRARLRTACMAIKFSNDCPADSEATDDLELGDWVADLSDDQCQTCLNAIETRMLPCDECGTLDESEDDDDDDDSE